MFAHVAAAVLALALAAHAQEATVWVDQSDEIDDVEKRFTPELEDELQTTKDDALLLYTEYSGRAGMELKTFLREMTGFAERTVRSMDDRILIRASESCKSEMERKLRKVEHDAKLSASFSGVNHHKFFLGHMVVFRMHLNKTEEYIRKCENALQKCGGTCETTPRIRRWRNHAAKELHRVQDDLQHSRRSYHDLLTHALRHLRHLRKQSAKKAKEATDALVNCV